MGEASLNAVVCVFSFEFLKLAVQGSLSEPSVGLEEGNEILGDGSVKLVDDQSFRLNRAALKAMNEQICR